MEASPPQKNPYYIEISQYRSYESVLQADVTLKVFTVFNCVLWDQKTSLHPLCLTIN